MSSARLPSKNSDSALGSRPISVSSGDSGKGSPACTSAASTSQLRAAFARRSTLSINPAVATFSMRPPLFAAAAATRSPMAW